MHVAQWTKILGWVNGSFMERQTNYILQKKDTVSESLHSYTKKSGNICDFSLLGKSNSPAIEIF